MRALPEASLNRLTMSMSVPIAAYRGLPGRDLVTGAALRQCSNTEKARRIATLLYTLLSGDCWVDEPGDSALGRVRLFWQSCPRLLLGGGILAGPAGITIIHETKRVLKEWGLDDSRVAGHRPAEHMPLYGALAGAPDDALGLDFGHGSLKASFAGKIYGPYPLGLDDTHEGADVGFSRDVHRRVVEALAALRRELGTAGAAVTSLAVSVAAYVHKGKFEENHRGAFCRLRDLDPDARRVFSRAWRDAADSLAEAEVYHDGTAAARLVKGPGAAIVFGTSAGHGFSPVS